MMLSENYTNINMMTMMIHWTSSCSGF